MSRLVVGVVGHVDHSKTALVRALTGTDTDRLAEEKRRGISIALGFAHLTLENGAEIDLIDMPGHERFVRTMVAGATGIDAVLVVVAANEGIKPQTVEHVAIAGLLGLKRAVVAVTKCDLVAADEAEKVAVEAFALLREIGLEGIGTPSPLLTSAESGEGVSELRQALIALAAEVPREPTDGVAFLPIDRAFVMTGHGPVVTGTLRGATVRPGDTLDLLPSGKSVRVRGVQVHGRAAEVAQPGSRVALNLRGVAIAELSRGMVLAEPGSLSPSSWLTLAITATRDAPPLRNGTRVRALFGTSEVEARLRLLDGDVLEPGATGFAQLNCAEPVALPAEEHVILRFASPARTVAGGRLIDPLAKRLRRHDATVLRRLSDLRDLPRPQRIAAEVDRATPGSVTLAGLARLCALPQTLVMEQLRSLPVSITRRGTVLRLADLDPLLGRLPALLGDAPLGLSRKQLASALAGVKAPLLDEALERLASDGTIARRGGQYLVPRPEEDRARASNEAELVATLAETLRLAGLTPPNPAALLPDGRARRAADSLLKQGAIVRCVDAAKGRELLFHRDAIAEARARLAPLLGGEGLLVTEIAAALGITRKFVMPLLAHLDAARFTQRVGDRRVLHTRHGLGEVDPVANAHRADREEAAA